MRLRGMKGGYKKALKFREEQIDNKNPAELEFREILDCYGVPHQYQYIHVYSYKFFIIDFVVIKDGFRYAIEIDGSSHDNKQEYDDSRDSILNMYGFINIKFTTKELINNKDGVVESLRDLNIITDPNFDPEDWLV